MKTWPRFSDEGRKRRSVERYEKETKALDKLTLNLSSKLKIEIKSLWLDFKKKRTKEGRFFYQADKMESFLQAYEYWKKFKNPPIGPWWLWAREFFDDPLLLKFIDTLEKKFHKK